MRRCAAAALVAFAALPLSAESPATADRQRPSLTAPRTFGHDRPLAPGVLLVSSRAMSDPNFARTVIVIVQRRDEGTMGLVVNRRSSASIADTFGEVELEGNGAERVFAGGPVAPTALQALVRSTSRVADGEPVAGEVHRIVSREALARRLDGPGLDRLRVFLGYSGWAAGQLEREIATGSWHVFEPDPDVVFDRDPATLWQRQIRRTDVYMVRTPVSILLVPFA